jgi:hypothetical protein
MASKEDDPAEWEKFKKELSSSYKGELKMRNRLMKDFSRELFSKRFSDEELLSLGMKDMVGVQNAADFLNMTESLKLDFNLNQELNSF